jgi:predicted ATPase/DNA-binding SARP family transcriptional activator
MSRLSLALLGPLQIELDERPITRFDSDKVRALLIYLALEAERPQRRAALAEMLWPEQGERAARHSLSQALFNLRQALGDDAKRAGVERHHTAQPPFLLITRDSVQFNGDSKHFVDAAAFGSLLGACDAHRHRRRENCATCAERAAAALDLYRGDFLAQFSLPDSVAFEEWSILNRERFRQVALQALETLAAYHELRGDYGRAGKYARQQIGIDPWRELAHRRLMRVLALDGQRSAALATYTRCCQLLADQLGVEPEQATTLLYQQIRDSAADTPLESVHLIPSALPHNLPAQLTPFVGREQELAQIGDILADPACRLLTIRGPGGIGKTRLAAQAALEQLDMFPDGVFFVPLAHLHEPELLATAIADALGLALSGADDPGAQLLRHLREKELLLLLDNFEHLLAAARALSDLLRAAPRVTLLVTSRERLDLPGEWLVEVAGLALPDDKRGVALERSSAGQLWLQTARRVQPHYTLSDGNRPFVVAICKLLEGMPLAIELAAGWVRVLGCGEIAQEITHSLALLATGSRDVPERHRSMHAVLDHSWSVLTGDEQRVLRRLAVFRGGFQRDAAAQVAGASLEQLATLVDKSLLRSSTHTANPRRYDMHELIRQYLLEQLAAADEREQLQNRHLQYILELVEQAASHFSGADEAGWMHRLETEHANLRAALEWALHRDEAETAGRVCAAIWRFWHTRGYLDEGRQWMARTLKLTDDPQPGHGAATAGRNVGGSPRRLSTITQAHVLKGAGVLAWAQSDYVEATATFEMSLGLFQALDDLDGMAAVSSNLGVLAMYQGDYGRAAVLLERSLALRRECGDRWGTAACLLNLGAMAGKQGDLPRAQAYYEESLALYRGIGHERAIAMLLLNLADIAEARGEVDQARAWATESLGMRRQLGDKGGMATALTRLGSLALRRNAIEKARTYYAESLTLLQALGDKEYIAVALEGFATLAAAEQQWEQAARLWGAAEVLRQMISVPLPPGMRAEYEAQLLLVQSHLDERVFARAWQEGRTMSLERAAISAMEASNAG